MARRPPEALSKSRFLSGLQCRKRLWTEVRRPDLVPPPDPSTRALFDRGHEIGELATRLFPGGLEIGRNVRSWRVVVEATRKALTLRRPLYEAAFRAGGGACRVDVLVPGEGSSWELIEVKSSTGVKEIHLLDAAFQSHVLESSGLELSGCSLLHVDTSYVRRGELDPGALFAKVDVSGEVSERLPLVREALPAMLETVRGEERPVVPIGPRCHEPYDCPLYPECGAFLGRDSVLSLHGLGRRAYELLALGVVDAREVPEEWSLDRRQRIQVRALESGRPQLDRAAVRAFLGRLVYPLRFFDLETVSPAIPRFEGSRPYQAIPFQYSVRRLESPDASPEHLAFLAAGSHDPRPEFLARLRQDLGSRGSIVAFHASYERGILRELVGEPGSPWLEAVENRLVDLREPFASFAYHHPEQRGSTSLKNVLPALTGSGYEGLAISDGRAAGDEFARVTWGEADATERDRVRRRLEAYCALDTGGMISVVEALRDAVA